MAIDIARREFILAFGGAAVAWPIAAGAQQSSRMRRMGLLVGYAENDSEAQAHIAALRETLQKLGWTANHDIQINERWASGDVDKIHRYAAELVRLNPDVIVGVSVSVVVALRNETRSIPIVFTRVSDPIGAAWLKPCPIPTETRQASPILKPRWEASGSNAERDRPRRQARSDRFQSRAAEG